MIVIPHAPRGEVTRIISMRKANRREQKIYQKRLGQACLKDAEIDYSDIPPLGKEFFQKTTVAWPPTKQQLTIRLDVDVLNWLRASGRGYQTRINRIFRTAMESTTGPGPHRYQKKRSAKRVPTHR